MCKPEMGDKRIRNLFKSEEDESAEWGFNGNLWKSTGAFMLQFVKEGTIESVIVDDYIALGNDG